MIDLTTTQWGSSKQPRVFVVRHSNAASSAMICFYGNKRDDEMDEMKVDMTTRNGNNSEQIWAEMAFRPPLHSIIIFSSNFILLNKYE